MIDISPIIIELIKRDMFLNKYLASFQKMEIELQWCELNLMRPIASLMGKNPDRLSNEWCQMYVEWVSQGEDFNADPLEKSLEVLAGECYEALKKTR
jgi:hypothetical protein